MRHWLIILLAIVRTQSFLPSSHRKLAPSHFLRIRGSSVLKTGRQEPCTAGAGETNSANSLEMRILNIPACDEPWTYEDTIRAAVCSDGVILLRWHISGPSSTDPYMLAVEAVTYKEEDTTHT